MKISVERGEVGIRNVVVRAHLEGRLYSVAIATPMEKHPIVTLASQATSAGLRVQKIELHRARQAAADFNPSVVTLVPEHVTEELLFDGGLFEIEWNRWSVMLIAIGPDVLDDGHTVSSWEEFARGQADYISGAS